MIPPLDCEAVQDSSWKGILSTGDQIERVTEKHQYLPIRLYLAACGENPLPRVFYRTLFTNDQKYLVLLSSRLFLAIKD